MEHDGLARQLWLTCTGLVDLQPKECAQLGRAPLGARPKRLVGQPMAEPRDQDGEMEHHISRKVVELQCHLNGREVVQDGQEERREAKGNEDRRHR